MSVGISRVLAHPLFAMVLGLVFILMKSHFSTQFYDWYWDSNHGGDVLIRAMMTGTNVCPTLKVYVGTEAHGTANSALQPQPDGVRQRRVFKVCFAVPVKSPVIASDVEKRAHVHIVQRLSPHFYNAFKPTLALDKLGTHPLQHIVRYVRTPFVVASFDKLPVVINRIYLSADSSPSQMLSLWLAAA